MILRCVKCPQDHAKRIIGLIQIGSIDMLTSSQDMVTRSKDIEHGKAPDTLLMLPRYGKCPQDHAKSYPVHKRSSIDMV
jgi:hypothetical protein